MSATPRTAEEARNLLESLRDRIDDLEAWRQGISAWKGTTNTRLEQLEEENQELRERVDELETIAEQAMTIASAGHDPESRSKKEVAQHLTRNELVRRAATGVPAQDRPLTIADVQDRAEPEHVLKWQTVRDAFDDLQGEWPQFRETTKGGKQALTVSRSDLTKALVRAVEADLGRDDLTKRLVGDEPVGGGSR